jgi:hypothetical protein
MGIHTYRGANIDSGHYLVGAKLRARISNAKKCYGSRQEKFDTQRLKDEKKIMSVRYKHLSSSAGKYYTTVDKCWITGRDVIKKSGRGSGWHKTDGSKKRLDDDECAQVTAMKNRSYLIMQQRHRTRAAWEEYEAKRREEKKNSQVKKTGL